MIDKASNEKQRVLMCYNSAEFGGVEKQILDIITGLSKEFDFIVVCPDGPLVKDYLNAGAIEHINLKPRFEADIKYSLEIRKILINRHCDVLHSHELLTGSLATFGGWLAKTPVRIYHVHTPFSQWQHKSLKKYFAYVINTIVNYFVGNFFATKVLALTESVKKIRIRKEFIARSKIQIIPNGVDFNAIYFDYKARSSTRKKYSIPDTTFVIGHLGRFTEEKGHRILIEAYASFCKKYPHQNTRLLLSGGGKLLSEMKKLTEQLSISSKVIFTDKFDDDQKKSLLSSMDLFVFPSLAEGFGIVLLEAMACGLPCIASNLPVLSDVGEDAVVYFEAKNSEDLANKLKELSDDKKALKAYSKNAFKQAQKYSIDKFYQNYKNLYLNAKN